MAISFSLRRIATALILQIFVLCCLVSAQTPPTPANATVKITLLQVNDVYQFTPVDRGTRGGLARLMTLRKQIAQDTPNTLFLMAGDTLSPSVESLTYKGAQMIEAWNAVGIDYAVFGNHEFDFGADVLRQRIKESKFAWLGANVTESGKVFNAQPPFVVREIGGVKLGIIGLVLPDTKNTSRAGAGIEFLEPCAVATKYIPQMQAEGAGVIIGLTHLSMREDKQLAQCAPALDIIIGGHEHTLLQSLAGRTPIFKMTSDAREMGRFDLFVNRVTGKLDSLDWRVIQVNDEVPPDPAFASVTAKYQELLTRLAQPVGRTAVELDARSAANRQHETNISDFIADAFRAATSAEVALLNGGSIRADDILPVGELTERDVLSILPFPNPVLKIQVTGATLKAALEHGVANSDNLRAEPGGFPQVSGLRYEFNPALPVGSRVTRVEVGGKLLDENRNYTLAVTDFIYGGGDGYTMFKDAPVLLKPEGAPKAPDILRNAIRQQSPIKPQTDGRIKRQVESGK